MTDSLPPEKAALFEQRERDYRLLRLRFVRALGWLEAVEQISALAQRATQENPAADWPRVIVSCLGFQRAALFYVSPDRDALTLISCAGGAPCVEQTGRVAFLRPLLDEEPDGMDNGDAPTELGAMLNLRRFLWSTFAPAPGVRYLAVVGFDEATWQDHPPFIAEDLRFCAMTARMLEALLGQLQSIRDLTSEREQLRALNEELVRRDRELRRTQQELLESTRLAAVGELAGVTAHEVLNPITSIQGRITRMMRLQDETFEHNRETLAAIPAAWAAAIARGGVPALIAELTAPSPMGGTLAEEDVAALTELGAYVSTLFAAHHDDLGFLIREIRRVTHIVDGMRGLSRRRSSPLPAALRALCAEAFDVLSDSFLHHQITANLECAGELVVEVDRYEFIQVLSNLLRNSVLAILERSGGDRTISVRAERNGDVILVFLEDQGVGISREHEPHLFEMRFSTRAESSGTGLGLSTARRLVRGWHGDLRLAWTRPGEGCCFVMELPICTSTTEPPPR